MRINVGKRRSSITLGKRGSSINIPLPRANTITQRDLVWLLFLGIAVLVAIGFFIHLATQNDRKWHHPVMVTGQGINIRDAPETGKIIAAVSAGDTLEINSISTLHPNWVAVSPRSDRKDFDNVESQGYILRRFLQIPDSTAKRLKKEGVLF